MNRHLSWKLPRMWALTLTTVLISCHTSCAGGGGGGALPADQLQRKLVEHQRIHFPERQFFVGIATGSTLEAATRSAYSAIMAQLPAHGGESAEILRDRCRVDRSSTDSAGTTHVLATLDRQETSTYVTSRARSESAKISEALKACAAQLSAGEVSQARDCLRPLQVRLKAAHQVFLAGRAVVGDQETTRRLPVAAEIDALNLKLQGDQISRRSVMLHILQFIDHEPTGDLNAELAPLLSTAGLKRVPGEVPAAAVQRALAGETTAALEQARAAGAGVLVIGAVRATFNSSIQGQFFSMAVGQIQVIETSAGRVLNEISSPELKGGHISREDASKRAIQNVTKRLKRDLSSALNNLPD